MTKFLVIASVIGVLGAGAGWTMIGAADTVRQDCPGKITCPLTGEQVCIDRCPVSASLEAAAVANVADELCGGACPAPTPAPKPQKPKGEGGEGER